jgi:uncharacterized protein YjiS (DUF1127 family)
MYPHTPYRRYPIFEGDDRRSPDRHRPLTIAVPATRPMHFADFLAEFAGPFLRPRISVLPALRRFSAMIREWRIHARSRRELLALDDRMLKDIGITRIDAQREAAKPFWR